MERVSYAEKVMKRLIKNKRMQKTGIKWVQDWALLHGKGNPLVTVQIPELWLFYQIVYAQTNNCLGKVDA